MHGQIIREVMEIELHPKMNTDNDFSLRKSWKLLISRFTSRSQCTLPFIHPLLKVLVWNLL
jgi:hypothetical protein